MASEFGRVWISNDGQALAWEVTGDRAGFWVLGVEDWQADESEILDLDAAWTQLGRAG